MIGRFRVLGVVVLTSVTLSVDRSGVDRSDAEAPPRAAAVVERAQLRVDQAGYGLDESKQAVLMTSRPAAGGRYRILRGDHQVGRGRVSGHDRGPWNATYRHTYLLRFGRLRTAGTY